MHSRVPGATRGLLREVHHLRDQALVPASVSSHDPFSSRQSFFANRREGLAMPDSGMLRSFCRLLPRLQRDTRANVAATFAIALVPLIASIGCAIDYSMATRTKA